MTQHSDTSVVDHIGDSTAVAGKSKKGPCICVDCKCKKTDKQQQSDAGKEVAEIHEDATIQQ